MPARGSLVFSGSNIELRRGKLQPAAIALHLAVKNKLLPDLKVILEIPLIKPDAVDLSAVVADERLDDVEAAPAERLPALFGQNLGLDRKSVV